MKNNNKMKIKNEMNIKNEMKNNIITKTSLEVLPSKVTSLGVFVLQLKKMSTGVLLILPLHTILFFIWWRFRYLIKIMAAVGDILNDNEFLWRYC